MKIEIPETKPGREHIYPFKSKAGEVVAIWAIILLSVYLSLVFANAAINYVSAAYQLPEWPFFAAIAGVALIVGLILTIKVIQKNAYIRLFGKTLTVVSKSEKEKDYYLPDFKEYATKSTGLERFYLIFEQDGKNEWIPIGSLGEENRNKLVNDIKVVMEKGDLPFEPGAEQTPEDLRLEEKQVRMERRERAEKMGMSLESIRKEEDEKILEVLQSLNLTDRMIVRRFLERGDKVNAIKTIREKSGAGLKDCKTASEMFFEVFKDAEAQ